MNTALIGDIGRFALHDGPGIRTTIFFMGCPLHCPWCHNPEFIAGQVGLALSEGRCIGCGECAQVCPESALAVDTIVHLDRSRCTCCGLCTDCCPTRTLELVGRVYEVEELVAVLLRDRLFYAVSGGGVTLSGGEPTAQMPFCSILLQRLQLEGIHTAMETNGWFLWQDFAATCLPYLDLVLFDVKIADQNRHRQLTGEGNERILDNLRRLVAAEPDKVIARIPLIPGFTTDADNICALVGLLQTIGVRRCSLLPYHPFGLAKARKVGLQAQVPLPEMAMDRTTVVAWQKAFTGFEIVNP